MQVRLLSSLHCAGGGMVYTLVLETNFPQKIWEFESPLAHNGDIRITAVPMLVEHNERVRFPYFTPLENRITGSTQSSEL